MKFRRAEIGIILTLLSNIPFTSWIFAVFWLISPFAGSNIVYGFLCAMTIIGLILLISDGDDFSHRMKGNGMVSAFLMILGFMLAAQGFLTIVFFGYSWRASSHPEGYQPTSQELTALSLFIAWAVLALISGVIWIFYGILVKSHKEADFLLRQDIDLDS